MSVEKSETCLHQRCDSLLNESVLAFRRLAVLTLLTSSSARLAFRIASSISRSPSPDSLNARRISERGAGALG
jgi:hypothetical protein